MDSVLNATDGEECVAQLLWLSLFEENLLELLRGVCRPPLVNHGMAVRA